MSKLLRPALATLFLAAAAGLLISHFSGALTLVEARGQPFSARSKKLLNQVALDHAHVKQTWAAAHKVWEKVTLPGGESRSASLPTLTLREPVIIVNGLGAGTSLEPGTPVALLSNQGRYLRVSHQQQILTVPRSAVQMSTSGLN